MKLELHFLLNKHNARMTLEASQSLLKHEDLITFKTKLPH